MKTGNMVIYRKPDKTRIMKKTIYILCTLLAIIFLPALRAQDPMFLKRTLVEASATSSDLSTETANYRALFGEGDREAGIVRGVKRFGCLTVEPGGTTRRVNYEREEQIYYILEGTGMLHYGTEEIPVSKNDFMYLPVGIEHGLSNPRESGLKVIVMGYDIPADREIAPTVGIQIASADDVDLQILGQHGPTTQFKLLLGTTRSRRDRIAAAYQVNSLFIMDFAPGGTNIPHTHPREEEIYLVLRGKGEMVAGGTPDNEIRHEAKEGDAFFFSPNILIGFYSGNKEGEPHAEILAVRSRFPVYPVKE
jgi:mannose-6-phosphate isomerase-like protein (cupin superfamily)